MDSDVTRVLIAIFMAVASVYWLYKRPGSNKKYIILLSIGFLFLIGGYVVKYIIESPRTLSAPLVICGLVTTLISVYLDYRFSKSKKGIKRAKKEIEKQEKEKKKKFKY